MEVVDCDEGNTLTQVVEEDFEQYEEMEDVSFGVDDRADNNEVEIIAGDNSTNAAAITHNRSESLSNLQQQSEATSTAVQTRDINPFSSRASAGGGTHRARQQTQHLLLVS